MTRRLPLLVGLFVGLVGWAAVALGGPSLGENRAEACGVPFEEEPVSYSLDWALWPPGATSCEWSGPAGSGTGLYVPWDEWLIVLLGAVGAGLLTSAVLPGRRLRLIRLALGVVLPLGALAAWFIGPI